MSAPSWRPTIAHVRATTLGLGLAAFGLLARRPDFVVLATPLLLIAAWAATCRPQRNPVVRQSVDQRSLREGEATTWRVHIDDAAGADDLGVVLDAPRYVAMDPVHGGVAGAVSDGRSELTVALRTTRWGRRAIGPATVVATSAWAGFRWQPVRGAATAINTLPLAGAFSASSTPASAAGLVGLDRSPRVGDGSEFAGIRPFQSGDRLRRVHWARSARSGVLHVTTTWSDHDRHIVVLVDASRDLGVSGGIDGAASSLDTTVRAAGAIAEHHLHRGDRVALQIIGARGVSSVPPATGVAHLRRILDRLSTIEPASSDRDEARRHLALPAGVLVVMLSPLISPLALERAVSAARRGIDVAVVDTLPSGLVDEPSDDPMRSIAWRIRLLERRREIRRVRELGIPLVVWRGPGSLDEVLREMHRRARAPRAVRR
jgi:uncharacterized protein (DUF58 family)